MRNSGSLVVSTLLLVAGMGLSSAGVPSSAPDAVGPPELAASAEVQALLAEAASLMENRRWEPALAKADQALETAQAVGDRAGAAPAKRLRAGALLRLRRTQEAAAAWREATVLWQALDEGPPQVEGLASEGIMLIAIDPESSEGIELISRALELAQKEESRHPLPTAQALHDAGHTALASKQQDNAIRLFSAAVCILDRYAPDSVALAESLIGLGRARIAQGEDLDAARASLVRALEISRKVAPGSAVEAKCLHRLGRLEETLENMPEAVDLYQQALRIKDVVDPAGFETFSVLTDLGTCEEELGNYDESRKHHLRALSIMEKISVDPLELVVPLINLGVTEDYAGNVDAAEAYYERNLEIQEKYGNDKARLAQALINVGNVALARWRFDVARERYESALAILVRYAPTNFGRGAALGNLAEMSYRQGDYEAAESYFRMNIAFLEENFPDSLMLSTALAGVGNVASMRGEPERAKAYHLRALEIRERKAPGSAYVSDSEAHLGSLCLALGELDEAEVHLRRGLDIEGPEATTRETASITSYLGRIAYRRGAFEEAARWHRRSAQIWAGIGGPQSPNVAVALADLAQALQGLGHHAEAFDAALQSESVRLSYLRTSSRTLTEREALAFGVAHQGALGLVLTVAADAGDRDPDAAGRAFDAVIRSRAVVLDEVAARNRNLWTAADPELAQLADNYAAAGDGLARLVVGGPEEDDGGEYLKAIEEARATKDRAERALAARSAEFRRELTRDGAGFVEVAGRMASAGALVAYVRFERVTPPSPQQETANALREERFEYAAFVLPAGSRDPVMVSLGSADEIDGLVRELRQKISSALAAGALAGKRATDQYRSVGTRLRERIWDPVARQLGDSKRVFVVPDGALNLVELAALPVGDSQYLVETGPRIHYLSAERDVLGFDDDGGGRGGLLALGDPAFDEPTLFAALAPEGGPVKLDETYRVASAGTYRGLRSSCGSFASMHFEPLPETGGEVDEVVGLWRKQARRHSPGLAKPDDVMSLRGASASEAAFKNLASGARVVHLATHGFFLGEGCPSTADGSRSAATGEVVPAVAGESPLLLSGFALAGANHRDAAGPDEEDGILTAEEIASLNLTNVDWAVLSACDTGVGEVRVGEGVFGLRRAFQVAGARTLIMSLWPVEDETTRQWMKALYSNRFAKGMSTIDAVHEANLEVLRHRREAGLSTHPAFWAGFIASGDWR